MPQSTLHTFDQHLCWHLAYNVNQLTHANPVTAELLGVPLLSYVADVTPQGIWLRGPTQLLSEYDQNRLAWAMAMTPRKPYWVPLLHITDLWHDCTAEIISGLSREMVMPWWEFSRSIEAQLSGDSITFGYGVDQIAEWTRMIRTYLRAMGKRHLVPAPEGGYPTPRCHLTSHPFFEVYDEKKANVPSSVNAPPTTDSSAVNSEPLTDSITLLVRDVHRIADALARPDQSTVDSPYVANRLGYTTTWVAEMVRQGSIPSSCVVTGTGNGKPWKFYREKIDEWINNR